MTHVLVTGGAGFIGTNVARYAVKSGIRVTIIDWATLSLEKSIEFDELGINYLQYDIRDLDKLNTINGEFDSIIHLAAQVSVPKSFSHQKETEEINIQGTENVISLAKKLGVKRFILASSSAVYGDCEEVPLTEKNTGRILSPYAETKFNNEMIIKKEFEKGNEFLALRFFNVYGPGQNAHSQYAAVIPKFLQFLKEKEPITIYGDGKQTRDFVHVTDVSRLLISLSVEKWLSPTQHVFNIGTGRSNTISQLVEIIMHVSDEKTNLEIQYGEERSGDITHSVASLHSTKEQLNWEPKITLEQGLRKLMTGF